MKLNNKGFAITTILYGTLILFLLLFVSLLGILNQYRKNLEKLIEENNGTRSIVTMTKNSQNEIPLGTTICNTHPETKNCQNEYRRGLYHIGGSCYKYLSNDEVATCD